MVFLTQETIEDIEAPFCVEWRLPLESLKAVTSTGVQEQVGFSQVH